jgi:1-acyl-sn-glycerol-3-phosphate acyltransferase
MDTRHYLTNSRAYSLVYNYVRFTFFLFYKEIHIKGIENIPDNAPVIFAPNHQNALMDALAVAMNTSKQPLFMARADIFQDKNSRKVLNFLKIIPVYRIRDGIKNMSQNDESFTISVACLKAGKDICLMPEGNHGERKQLRPLKKGISRIAFKAQEEIGSTANVYVIPVGLDVSNYDNFRSNMHISIGKPLKVKDYENLYTEDSQKAFSELRSDLANELKQLMIHIDSDEYYEIIISSSKISWFSIKENMGLDSTYKSRFQCEKLITDKLNTVFNENKEIAEELKKMVTEYNALMNRLSLNNAVFEDKHPKNEFIWDIARYVVFLPFACAGALFNLIPALLTNYIAGKTKDPQFISTMKYGAGTLLFPIYYILFLLSPIPLISKMLLIITMPIFGILAYDYFSGLSIFIKTIKYRMALNQNDATVSRLTYLRTQIINRISSFLFPQK